MTQNEDDGLGETSLKLEGWIKRHRQLFAILVLMVYVGIMLPFIVFLIKYLAWREANVCEICINISKNITSIGGSLPSNLTLP